MEEVINQREYLTSEDLLQLLKIYRELGGSHFHIVEQLIVPKLYKLMHSLKKSEGGLNLGKGGLHLFLQGLCQREVVGLEERLLRGLVIRKVAD